MAGFSPFVESDKKCAYFHQRLPFRLSCAVTTRVERHHVGLGCYHACVVGGLKPETHADGKDCEKMVFETPERVNTAWRSSSPICRAASLPGGHRHIVTLHDMETYSTLPATLWS